MITIDVDPTPKFRISPRLYMQFMEPLGTTDPSVEAGWNFLRQDWREDLIEVVRDLAPGAIRWGGILTSYWKWREGVGPRGQRRPMVNYLWGGVETNQIGVHEIIDFCERVGAEPLMAVNFAADGRPEYIGTPLGENRAGTPEEAADLVSYCNDPDHPERRANGRAQPWSLKLWQIGNETSYPPAGQRFTSQENARHYAAFAKALRSRDPGIELIGWGDREEKGGPSYAVDLLHEAGDLVDYVALHMMHQRPPRPDTILRGDAYRKDYARAWNELNEVYALVESKLLEAREVVRGLKPDARLTITEGHLTLQPHNKCNILREWISGLYHARVLNLFERHADMVEVSTLADFCGNTWTVNAVMLGSPRERPYLLPVGHIMRLYRRHGGDEGLQVVVHGSDLDVAASRRGNRIYLHVVNTDLDTGKPATIRLATEAVTGGRAYWIAPADLSASIDTSNPDVFRVEEAAVPSGSEVAWIVPKASVTVLELEVTAREAT